MNDLEKCNLAIVVIAYNRIKCLSRLMSSLISAEYCGDRVDIIISIDKSTNNDVECYARNLEWPHGEIKIVAHKARMGLKAHVLSCGALTELYNDLCVFEDDLYASPSFYIYAKEAISHFRNFPDIAGISLYAHYWNPYVNRPFSAVQDGYDAYLMQIASSWGQIWSKQSWRDFANWIEGRDDQSLKNDCVPEAVSNWSEKSWLKYHNCYLIERSKYFVYPRISLTTNFSDPGEHANWTTTYQVDLQLRMNRKYAFPKDFNSATRYDAFFENSKLNKYLSVDEESLDVSLYGNRIPRRKFLLTSKILNYKIRRSFGVNLRPIDLNIIFEIPGEEIFLYEIAKEDKNAISKFRVLKKQILYDIKLESKERILFAALAMYFDAFKRKVTRWVFLQK